MQHEERMLIEEKRVPDDVTIVVLTQARLDLPVRVVDDHEPAMTAGADARAACYVEVRVGDSPTGFGAGIDGNLPTASLKAAVSGINRHLQHGAHTSSATAVQAIEA